MTEQRKSQEDIDYMKNLYAGGKTMQEIAEELGVTRQAVNRFVKAGKQRNGTAPKRACLHCGEMTKRAKYCSYACVHAAKDRPKLKSVCEVCGKEFEYRNRYIGRFCSQACRWAEMRKKDTR